MSHLVIPNITCTETTANFGRFVAEPLEKGFGTTLGNSLRRVLLAYLPGAAVTWIKIEGIQHEFSTIPHAKEDTIELLLNIKAIRLKSISGQAGRLALEIEGEGKICAANIKPSADFEIANPELYLVTLDTPEAKLEMELNVELGTGYQQAEFVDNLPVGAIPVDAIFSPVRKVNISVEPVHIGRETSRERLVLDVWTDGTIPPVDAVTTGAEILVGQLSQFVDYARVSQMEEEKQLIRQSIPDEKFNMPIEQLDLSVRTLNSLRRSNINTVGELVTKGEKELLSIRNFGQKSKQELAERLEELGLSLVFQTKKETEEDEA